MEPVGDDRPDVKAAMQHHGHLVPGFVHLPAVNAFDREHVEHDFLPVNRHFLGGYAQHCDFSAMAHVVDHVAEGHGMAGHLEPDVETLLHTEFPLRLANTGVADIQYQCRSHLFRQFEAVLVDIGDNNESGARMLYNCHCHDADGPGARDQHIFTEHGKRERRMHRVAEWVEDSGHVAIDGGMVM